MQATTQTSGSEPSTRNGRLYFIDNLRIALITGVVLVHLAVTYGAPGTWYYHEFPEIDTISLVFYALMGAVGQSLMGFFFLISAYFIPASFARKGRSRYLKDRLLSLGLPLLFYVVAIDPLIIYLLRVNLEGFRGSLADFLTSFLSRYTSLGVGPLWFVEALLIFTLVYGFVAQREQAAASEPLPKDLHIGLFALVLGLITFVLRIWIPAGYVLKPFGLPIGSFPQYIALFIVGTVAASRRWFIGIPDRTGRRWLVVSLVMILVVFPTMFLLGGALEGNTDPFMGGLHWQSLIFSLWEQSVCVSLVIAVLVWFRKRFDRQGRLAQRMSSSAYTVYLLHAPVLVLIGLGLRGITLHPLLKFVMVSPIAVGLCFLISDFLRRLPLLRSIL